MTGSSFQELANLLSLNFTIYYYDRRGRGESTDTLPYSVDKEIEDIDALIDVAGGSAYLYGISSGACLALEAASQLGTKVTKLALYEPPYDENEDAKEKWHEYTTNLKKALSSGDRTTAVILFMKLVGVPDEMINGMKQSPMWPGLEKVAPTLVYDAACMGDDRSVPVESAKKVISQTLIMDGGANLQMMPFMHDSAERLAKVIPNAKQQTIEGQTHDIDSKVLAPILREFFNKQ
jgi:pimeloyl-ACP methyl ester carboxylesterase